MYRTHQPYQNPVMRPKTSALQAMLAGRGTLGNPMDHQRLLQKNALLRLLRR